MSSAEDFFSANSSTPDSDPGNGYKVFTKKVPVGGRIPSSLTGLRMPTKEEPAQSSFSSIRSREHSESVPRGPGWSGLRLNNIGRGQTVDMQQQWAGDEGYRQNESVSPDPQHYPNHNHRSDRSSGYSSTLQNGRDNGLYRQERYNDYDIRQVQHNSNYYQNDIYHSGGSFDRDFPRSSFNYARPGELSEPNEDGIDEEEDEEEEEGEADRTFREKLLYKDRSYSEKMAIVADNIKILTTCAVSDGGYDGFQKLKEDFAEHTNMNAEDVAYMMGYTSFKALCLYAPEVVNLHKWTRYERNGKPIIKEYVPRDISKEDMQLIREKTIGEMEKLGQIDRVEGHIQEIMSKEVIPTYEEVDFKYRLCEALDAAGGLNKSVKMSALGDMYQKMYGEALNSKLKREMFSLKTNHDLNTIEKERLRIEMKITPNPANNGLMYRLTRPLGEIKKYHDRLRHEIAKRMEQDRQAREKEDERLPPAWRKFTPTSKSDSKKKGDDVSASGSIRFG